MMITIPISECKSVKATRSWHKLCDFIKSNVFDPIDEVITRFREQLDPDAVAMIPYELNIHKLPNLSWTGSRCNNYRCDSCGADITGDIWSSEGSSACSQECANKLAPDSFIQCPPIPTAEQMKAPGSHSAWMSYFVDRSGPNWRIPATNGSVWACCLDCAPGGYVIVQKDETTFCYDGQTVTVIGVKDGKVNVRYEDGNEPQDD